MKYFSIRISAIALFLTYSVLEGFSQISTIPGNITKVNNSICAGTPAILTLSGHSGTVLKWQRSTTANFASGNTNITNTKATLIDIPGSKGIYYYRVLVYNNDYQAAVFSTPVTITVEGSTPSVGGTSTSMGCNYGSNTEILNNKFNVKEWPSKADIKTECSDIENSTKLSAKADITCITGNITIEKTNGALYEIIDLTGKLVHSGYFSESLVLNDMPRGLFMLKLESDNNIQYEKLSIR